MRCPNCGWKNPSDKTNCYQCQTPLQPSEDARGGGNDAHNKNVLPGSNSAASTIRGDQPNITAWDETVSDDSKLGNQFTNRNHEESSNSRAMRICKCGYHNVADAAFCVSCGTQIGQSGHTEEQKQQEWQQGQGQAKQHYSAVAQTINPWSNKKRASFRLNLVAREGENLSVERAYSGDMVSLNRANLEPDNPTITNNVQAIVEFKNGEWYLMNQSAMKTTFVRVDEEPVKLKNGDMLLFGDRLFKFDC